MQGLELSERYFEAYGRRLIEEDFAPYKDRIAAGLVGQGSERYGYDSDVSRDHDFCAGFCLWISREDDTVFGFELQKAYRHLAEEFLGVSTKEHERGGRSRYGVMTHEDFFEPLIGKRFASPTAEDFLYVPSHYFADCTNGKIFYDGNGSFTAIYENLKHGMPEDVRLKKIAAGLCGMAQSGQYNYARCLSHDEEGAAVLALTEFVKYTSQVIYLLNGRHAPYYKWLLRGLGELETLGALAPSLEYLLTCGNGKEDCLTKGAIIEDICVEVAKVLISSGLSDATDSFMEAHAKAVTRKITDVGIRNLHMMIGL